MILRSSKSTEKRNSSAQKKEDKKEARRTSAVTCQILMDAVDEADAIKEIDVDAVFESEDTRAQ